MRNSPRRLLTLPLALASLLTGCGTTFGVDVTELNTDLDMSAEGIDRFEMLHVGVDDEVVIEGGGDRVAVHLEMLDWNARPDRIRAELADRGDVARLQMISSESITLVSVGVSIPETTATSIDLSHGSLSLSYLSAPATVSARSVTLRDVAAPVVAEASHVEFNYAVPLDLTTSGSVYGRSSSSGVLHAEGDVQLSLTGSRVSEFEVHSTNADESAFVEVFLPPGARCTVFLRTPGHALLDAGDVNYDSLDEGAASPASGLTFDVGGGGPLLTLTASTGSILVTGS